MATSTDEIAALKERQQAVWAMGDYASVATFIEDVAALCVERAAVEHGEELLDVATGTGNAAIEAARRGAVVTGLDLTPELLEIARKRAMAERVDITWVAGDAEALPFGDGSFDCATSTFGVMFAPRHAVAARELTRVLRPGGRFVLSTWAPDGMVGRTFGILGAYIPPPPEGTQPPILWGDEPHVRSVFDGLPVELSFSRHTASIPFGSGDEYVAYYEERFGPVMTARKIAEPQGRWGEARGLLVEAASRHFRDGAVHHDYHLIEGTIAGG